MANLNKQEIVRMERLANDFNYTGDGEEYGYAGDSDYIGNDDLDFGGDSDSPNRNFSGEMSTNRIFSFRLQNTSATLDRDIALNPAIFDTVARMQASEFPSVVAILADGVIFNGSPTDQVIATATDSTKSIFHLLQFVKQNPTRVVAMTITSTNPAQFEKTIRVTNVSPFRSHGNKTISLTTYLSAGQLSSNKIDVNLLANNEVIDLNNQNVPVLTVAAASSLTITLFIGAISNPVVKLQKKAKVAHRNIKKVAMRRF